MGNYIVKKKNEFERGSIKAKLFQSLYEEPQILENEFKKAEDGNDPDLSFVGYGLDVNSAIMSLESYLSTHYNITIQFDNEKLYIKTKKLGKIEVHVSQVGDIYKVYLDI